MKHVLVRITINLPEQIDKRIREYGDGLGLNYTNSVIDLINRGLQQNDTIKALALINSYSKEKKPTRSEVEEILSSFE